MLDKKERRLWGGLGYLDLPRLCPLRSYALDETVEGCVCPGTHVGMSPRSLYIQTKGVLCTIRAEQRLRGKELNMQNRP
ncbi:hypothetical protein VFPBJ_05361 [Purpureocillium lilacinum]|uniref:Uncharacterized protein n=1 Tax=Purpureocillium lilacinum TaxID=33203 RepID=A0A179GPC7_PURLI|nr:hypothetical protein VFPBJ_05361 [Purpureocillium lilacinum]